jgi:hypothetical protein
MLLNAVAVDRRLRFEVVRCGHKRGVDSVRLP